MTTIMAEYTDIPMMAISDAQREYFYVHQLPPPNWAIWIGRYSGKEWNDRYRHVGHLMSRTPEKIVRPYNKCNVQFTLFVIGSFYAFVRSTVEPDVFEEPCHACGAYDPMRLIWPLGGQIIEWPIPFLSGDTELNSLGYSLPDAPFHG